MGPGSPQEAIWEPPGGSTRKWPQEALRKTFWSQGSRMGVMWRQGLNPGPGELRARILNFHDQGSRMGLVETQVRGWVWSRPILEPWSQIVIRTSMQAQGSRFVVPRWHEIRTLSLKKPTATRPASSSFQNKENSKTLKKDLGLVNPEPPGAPRAVRRLKA